MVSSSAATVLPVTTRASRSVSVVIPCYNYAHFVADAINSVLTQTFKPIQIVVVDDGSTDNSLDVIKSFGDRIDIIAQPNNGHAAAENVGYARTTGDVIFFLDADDFLYPSAVERVMSHVDATTSKVQFYLEAVSENKTPRGFTAPERMPTENKIETLLFRYGSYPSPPTSGNAYARSFLERVLPFPEKEFLGATDNYVMVLAPLYGQVKVCAEPLGGYRLHGKNMSAVLSAQSLKRMREETLINAARQRTLEAHCFALRRSIRTNLDLRQPYTCKRRLISLKADPHSHPFSTDHPFKLARKGLAAAVTYPDLSIANRLALLISFLIIPLLPQRAVSNLVPILDGGRREFSQFLSRLLGRPTSPTVPQ